ncbi:hypothetical protein DPMN_148259 [Dreissena polymorpha]|uniref:Uncharacterized protein n=1 Tax=Dreissena polymorpha TaxID=45954 RepID=A0A9D4J018_DREPO|nr:hypothetical protein DPMN_148259 [Dreissena polymorpha]
MEVSTKKSNIMVNSTNSTTADITMNGKTLEGVTSCMYLGNTNPCGPNKNCQRRPY